ncbi:MAG TPA: hypothetical protein VHP34_10055 [Alphaproteobacteria bacterium]|nr:hypothetical protein [Alphaproteobacteria bacterium]
MPIAAHIPSAAAVNADDFRLINMLCRFAGEALRSACFAPIRHIFVYRSLVFMCPAAFAPFLAQSALCRFTIDLCAIFQPEET